MAEKATKSPKRQKPVPKSQKRAPKKQTAGLAAKHERFAQLCATGQAAAAAYREVYGDRKGVDASASRLRSSAKVAARIAELQKQTAAAAVLTLAEKREFLRRVVTTPIGAVNETSELCQAAKYGETTREFKMPCKLRAIELDAKLAGELRENPELKIEAAGDVYLVTPKRLAELQRRRAEALKTK